MHRFVNGFTVALSFQLNITFDEHNCLTFEYPSEQYLMSESPARPGDYDFIDDSAPPLSPRSDTDDDDDSPYAKVAPANDVAKPTQPLKSSPAVGSGTGSIVSASGRRVARVKVTLGVLQRCRDTSRRCSSSITLA